DLAAVQAERDGHALAHRLRVIDALDAGAGIGIAAVRDDGAEVALPQVGLRELHRGSLDAIDGKGACGRARAFRIDQRKVEPVGGRILDATGNGRALETARGTDAA